MKVRVRLMGVLRDAAGTGEHNVTLGDKASVTAVLDALIEQIPGLGEVIMDRVVGDFTPNALVLVDGVEVSNLQGPDTVVGDGSELVLLPVTHGG
ncbi:MoaD/ThiS family protein [Candidatus Bathyarchaeota archaeon]|nr:MoaD/ThiS family protein [Candidatus Bathyarchaeota archaeon]